MPSCSRPGSAVADRSLGATPEPDKDWGPTKPTTVREALRDAMALEMRAND